MRPAMAKAMPFENRGVANEQTPNATPRPQTTTNEDQDMKEMDVDIPDEDTKRPTGKC